MSSVSNKKLRTLAKKHGEKISVATRRESDFAKLAEPYRGMFQGPRDLSTREGYGKLSRLS